MTRSRFAALAAVVVAAAAAASLIGDATGATPSRTFVGAVVAVPSQLDSAVYEGRPSSDLGAAFAANLVRYKRIPSTATTLQGPFAVTGYIAQSWKRNANGSYTFTLRNARSPYGNTVSSADVKWSFERMVAADAIARFLFGVVGVDTTNPITIVNAKTFTLNLTHPSALALAFNAYYSVSIFDSTEAKKHATESDPWAKDWLSKNSANYSAYTVDSFTPGQELRLKRNPNFWGQRPYFDNVIFRAVPDAGVRTQLIQAGSVNYTNNLTWDQLRGLAKAKLVKVYPTVDANTDALILNKRRKEFADARVRKAIWMAIDRKAVINSVYAGFGKAATSGISSAIPRPKPVVTAQYDPAGAKQLLAQAGYADGFSFTLTVCPCRPGAYSTQLAELLQRQLGAIGLKVTIDVVAASSEFEANRRGKYEAFILDTRPVIVDPIYSAALDHRTAPAGLQNFDAYSNPKLDKLVNAGLVTGDGPRRNRLIASVESTLAADVPWVKLVETPGRHALRSDIKGFSSSPTGGLYIEDLSR